MTANPFYIQIGTVFSASVTIKQYLPPSVGQWICVRSGEQAYLKLLCSLVTARGSFFSLLRVWWALQAAWITHAALCLSAGSSIPWGIKDTHVIYTVTPLQQRNDILGKRTTTIHFVHFSKLPVSETEKMLLSVVVFGGSMASWHVRIKYVHTLRPSKVPLFYKDVSFMLPLSNFEVGCHLGIFAPVSEQLHT